MSSISANSKFIYFVFLFKVQYVNSMSILDFDSNFDNKISYLFGDNDDDVDLVTLLKCDKRIAQWAAPSPPATQ